MAEGRFPRDLTSLVDATDRRLLHTGLPLLVTSATMVLIPVIARQYLDDGDYAVWALLLTVIVSAGLLDLGGSAYVQSLGFGRRTTPRQYLTAIALAAGGAALVAGVAAGLIGVVLPRMGVQASAPEVHLLVLACGLAAVVRGAVQVMLARLQIAERFTLRSTTAVLQAAVQVCTCWLLLARGYGLWSLAGGILAGSALALLTAHLALVLRPDRLSPTRVHAPVARFAFYRTTATVLGILSSQGDRWVLAAVAAPAFLADYDLALRFALVPLGVVGAMVAGIIAEAPATAPGVDRRRLVDRYTRRVAAIIAVLSVLDVGAVLVLGALGVVPISGQLLGILGMALVWSGANALTAPTTFAFVGIGQPQRELLYAAPTLACLGLAWALAIAVQTPWLVPVGALMAITGWSLWFTHYGRSRAAY